MVGWQFVKVKTVVDDILIVSKIGEFSYPVAVFEKRDIKELLKEWERNDI